MNVAQVDEDLSNLNNKIANYALRFVLRDKGNRWGSVITKEHTRIANGSLSFDPNKVKISTFPVVLKHEENSLHIIDGGTGRNVGVFINIGDSQLDPHYQTGSGAVRIIEASQKFGEMFERRISALQHQEIAGLHDANAGGYIDALESFHQFLSNQHVHYLEQYTFFRSSRDINNLRWVWHSLQMKIGKLGDTGSSIKPKFNQALEKAKNLRVYSELAKKIVKDKPFQDNHREEVLGLNGWKIFVVVLLSILTLGIYPLVAYIMHKSKEPVGGLLVKDNNHVKWPGISSVSTEGGRQDAIQQYQRSLEERLCDDLSPIYASKIFANSLDLNSPHEATAASILLKMTKTFARTSEDVGHFVSYANIVEQLLSEQIHKEQLSLVIFPQANLTRQL